MFDSELAAIVAVTISFACICSFVIQMIKRAARSELPFIRALRIESQMFAIASCLERDIAKAFEEVALIRDLHSANGRMSAALDSARRDYATAKVQLEQRAQVELSHLSKQAQQWGMAGYVQELYETMAGQYPSLGLLRLAD